MATTARLAATVATVLLTCGIAPAQLPTAPPPHLPLGEVVAEYQRLGLPVPPPGAELVRVYWWRKDDGEAAEPYFLAFRLARGPQHDPRCDVLWDPGGWEWWGPKLISPAQVEPVPPTVRALDRVDRLGREHLCLAVLCRLRGWDELARELYRSSLEQINQSPIRELREVKWSILKERVHERGSDRAEICRQLLPLADVAPPDVRQPASPRPGLLRQLELTIAPRRSKPGTVEALIDDLIDYWHDNDDPTNESGREAYWKLVEMGFDAVPALLDHLDDERYTYALVEWSNGIIGRPVLVGDLAGEIIYRLAGGRIEGIYEPAAQRGVWLDPKPVRKWWETVRRADEEKWLADRTPDENVLRVLGAKYPNRLREAYLDILRTRAVDARAQFVAPILASRLPREEKIALFVRGASTQELGHRAHALRGLAGIDRELFRKHLLLTLREGARLLGKGEEWPDDLSLIVRLVSRAGDRDCWDVLAAVAKASPYDLRRLLLEEIVRQAPPGRPDPAWRERVKFLMKFLDDPAAGPSEEAWHPVEIRDIAATQLMDLLGFPVQRDYQFMVEYDWTRDPLTLFVLRAAVRQATERELARPEK